MKISSNKIKEVLDYLEKINPNPKCPFCSSTNFIVNDNILQLTDFDEGVITPSVIRMPVIAIICGKCGNITLINAFCVEPLKDIFKPKEDKKEEKKEDKK